MHGQPSSVWLLQHGQLSGDCLCAVISGEDEGDGHELERVLSLLRALAIYEIAELFFYVHNISKYDERTF